MVRMLSHPPTTLPHTHTHTQTYTDTHMGAHTHHLMCLFSHLLRITRQVWRDEATSSQRMHIWQQVPLFSNDCRYDVPCISSCLCSLDAFHLYKKYWKYSVSIAESEGLPYLPTYSTLQRLVLCCPIRCKDRLL